MRVTRLCYRHVPIPTSAHTRNNNNNNSLVFPYIEGTVESRFLEPSVSRTSRYFEPNLVSLGFASLKLYNFTPDFSNPRFLETPDNSNQFWLPWDKLTLDTSNLRKFPKYLVPMSIKFTLLNKLGTSIICAKVPRTFLKSLTRVSRLQRGNKLLQIISAKLSERYIQTTRHHLCSVMFRFCFLSTICS